MAKKVDRDFPLTRSQIEEYFTDNKNEKEKQILGPVKEVVKSLNGRHVDRLIFVGGSSSIPYVRECVEREVGVRGYSPLNPDEAISQGAAIYGAYLVLKEKGQVLNNLPHIEIKDVTPLDIHMVSSDNSSKLLIKRKKSYTLLCFGFAE